MGPWAQMEQLHDHNLGVVDVLKKNVYHAYLDLIKRIHISYLRQRMVRTESRYASLHLLCTLKVLNCKPFIH